MELGVFQYHRDGNEVRIDDVMRIGGGAGLFPGGAALPLRGNATQRQVRLQATRFLRAQLPKLTGSHEGAALVLSASCARLLKGWTAAGIGTLLDIGMSRVGRKLANDAVPSGPAQGFPLPFVYPDDASIYGFIAPDGAISVLKCRWPGVVDKRSWIMVPAALGLEWQGRVPDDMLQDLVDLSRCGMADIDIWSQANRMFWQKVVPAMEDPFLRQQRCWIGTSIGIEDFMSGHGQPVAELSYRVGGESQLVRFVAQVMGLTETVQPILSGVLTVFGAIELKIRAASATAPAQLLRVDIGELPEPTVRVIDRLLSIIAPTGVEYVGALRLSGARAVPAEITCLLTRHNVVVPSGHERIQHAVEIENFLVENGVEAAEARALIDAI